MTQAQKAAPKRRGRAIARTKKLETLKQKHSKLAGKLNTIEIEINKIEVLIELDNFLSI